MALTCHAKHVSKVNTYLVRSTTANFLLRGGHLEFERAEVNIRAVSQFALN
jgi:hypothetical protein